MASDKLLLSLKEGTRDSFTKVIRRQVHKPWKPLVNCSIITRSSRLHPLMSHYSDAFELSGAGASGAVNDS